MADPRFVVQRHRARRLHYDLRFEIDGVLVSWAVPKGPTLDPDVRRAAFQVDDHPLDYYDFEGIIPAGTYGGGDVVVWDAGTFVAPKSRNPRRSVEKGELHVELFGQKLRGTFVLVRTGDDNQWLLLHKHDEFAVKGWDPEDHPRSVLSGRTSEEVAADPDRLWRSDLPAAQAAVALKFTGPSEDELAALDDLGASGTWQVHGRELKVTNLDKAVVPGRARGEPIRKRELLRYAAQLGPTLVRYLKDRALAVPRLRSGAPDWIEGDTEPATLVWIVNHGTYEWRVPAVRTDRPDQPDMAIVDLDIGDRAPYADLLALAQVYRTALDHLGVTGRAQLTGRRSMQLCIPVRRGPSTADVRAWIDRLIRTVAAAMPDVRATAAPGDVLVAPYSPRLEPGAPVAIPIAWDELDDKELRPDRFTIRTIGARLAEHGDLFGPVLDEPRPLPDLVDPG